MYRIALRLAAISAVMVAMVAVHAADAKAQGRCHRTQGCQPYSEPYGGDLFYNHYSQGYCDRPAELYPAPLPTPPMVGRTYITYQPMMPHEYMYKHSRSYHSYYDGGKGLNRTLISYSYNPITTAVVGLRNALRLPR